MSDGHETVLRYYKTRPANAHVMAQGSMQCRGMQVSNDAGMSFSGKLFCFHVTAAYSSEAQGRDSFKDHDDAKHRIVCGCDSEEAGVVDGNANPLIHPTVHVLSWYSNLQP